MTFPGTGSGEGEARRISGTAIAGWAGLALILLATAAVRIRLLGIPLERDEGGFAYIGRLILHGSPIYHDAFDFKPPGLYLAYAGMMALFGESPAGVHAGFLVVNLVSILLLFRIARRYSGVGGGLAAAFVFAFLSLTPNVLGFAGHATHLVVVCMLAGYDLLLSAGGRKKAVTFAAGAAFGLAGMMKQPGILFMVAGIVLIVERRKEEGLAGPLLRFVAGAVAAAGLLTLWVALAGDFRQFVYWNFVYGVEFGSQVGPGEALRLLPGILTQAAGAYALLWLIGAAGWLLALTKIGKEGRGVALPAFGLISCIAVSAGFVFRPHYFVLLLPAIGLFCGFVLAWAREKFRTTGEIVLWGLLIAGAGAGIAGDAGYYISTPPREVSRARYYPNIFFAAGEIADSIRAETGPDDRVAILGSEPELLFLSGRRSATPYLFMYFLMEAHPQAGEMQAACIRDIEGAMPAEIVLVRQEVSWAIRPWSERRILDWMTPYLKERYEPVGLVDLPGPGVVEERWGRSVFSYRRLADADVLIFRLKGGEGLRR